MPRRTNVVGDIHGCLDEFTALLERVKHAPRSDRLILLGDLINRGPANQGVLRKAREIGAECIQGNHERRLLRYYESKDDSILKAYDFDTIEEMDAADWRFMKRFQPWIELPEFSAVCVHAGFLPDTPWDEQPPEVYTRIQVIDENGQAAKRSEAPGAPLWSTRWEGPPYVVYGHTPQPEIERNPWSIGIDTGCVYGGHLTAMILPERRIVQVEAARNYSGKRMALTRWKR